MKAKSTKICEDNANKMAGPPTYYQDAMVLLLIQPLLA